MEDSLYLSDHISIMICICLLLLYVKSFDFILQCSKAATHEFYETPEWAEAGLSV